MDTTTYLAPSDGRRRAHPARRPAGLRQDGALRRRVGAERSPQHRHARVPLRARRFRRLPRARLRGRHHPRATARRAARLADDRRADRPLLRRPGPGAGRRAGGDHAVLRSRLPVADREHLRRDQSPGRPRRRGRRSASRCARGSRSRSPIATPEAEDDPAGPVLLAELAGRARGVDQLGARPRRARQRHRVSPLQRPASISTSGSRTPIPRCGCPTTGRGRPSSAGSTAAWTI